MANDYLTTQEAAKELGVSQRTVQLWISKGEFPAAHKLNPSLRNSPYRIPESDVATFKEKQQRGSRESI